MFGKAFCRIIGEKSANQGSDGSVCGKINDHSAKSELTGLGMPDRVGHDGPVGHDKEEGVPGQAGHDEVPGMRRGRA